MCSVTENRSRQRCTEKDLRQHRKSLARWRERIRDLTLTFLLLPLILLLYSQSHLGCSWLGSKIIIFVFSSSECSYSVVMLRSCQAFSEESKQKGNARISDSLRFCYTTMEIHEKMKGTFLASSFLYNEFQRLAASEMFYLKELTTSICGFSWVLLIFSVCLGYLN